MALVESAVFEVGGEFLVKETVKEGWNSYSNGNIDIEHKQGEYIKYSPRFDRRLFL